MTEIHDASAPAVAGSVVSGGSIGNSAANSGKMATAAAGGGGMMAQLGNKSLDMYRYTMFSYNVISFALIYDNSGKTTTNGIKPASKRWRWIC